MTRAAKFPRDGLTETERLVQEQQIREAGGCPMCKRRGKELFPGKFVCTLELQFPRCRKRRRGFLLDDGE